MRIARNAFEAFIITQGSVRLTMADGRIESRRLWQSFQMSWFSGQEKSTPLVGDLPNNRFASFAVGNFV